MASLYNVAIVGRVNVGKSTLFNKLISDNVAIISPIAGTTRDRNYEKCSWNGVDFNLIDTGGLERQSDDDIDAQISEQALQAIDEADLVLLVVDTLSGIMPTDEELALILKRKKKPVLVVANKADTLRMRNAIADFYQLNLGEPIPVSANSGSGTGDMLDILVDRLRSLPKKKTSQKEEKAIRVAIMGKPNVGKSSIINSILGEKRLIVSPTAHTTRDSQNIEIKYQKNRLILVDTAGLRKKGKKTHDAFEKQSIEQSIRSMNKSQIVILVTDVSKRLTFQDKHLIDEISRAGRGLIMVANKWDLIPDKDEATIQEYQQYYKRYFPFISWAPLIFTSATENIRVKKILEMIIDVRTEMVKEISDNALAKLLNQIVKRHKPSRGKGTKHPYIYSLRQIATDPPRFAIKTNFKADLHDSYLRFIENGIRYKFGFEGVPIKIIVEKTQNLAEEKI